VLIFGQAGDNPMVSDVLFDAVDGLRYYLKEPTFRDVYTGKLRKRIEHLVKEMESIRVELDCPPKSK
jgi:hypothetical protein